MKLLSLTERSGLPEDLQTLVKDFPREDWAGRTGPFTAFYLERHEMFRRMTERMRQDAEAMLSGAISAQRHAAVVSRLGGQFLSGLHGHHQIEDNYYFPRLAPLERGVAHAFDLLEADHTEIDRALSTFQSQANAAIRAAQSDERTRDATGAFHEGLLGLEALLERHLEDEEDIVVPLMLKYGEASVEH